jgi:type I restriction enzyme S subunit
MPTRLRYLAALNPPTPELALMASSEEVTFLPLDSIWPDGRLKLDQRRVLADGLGSYNVVREGDVLVPKVTPTFEHNRVAEAVGLHNGLALATTEVFVVRPYDAQLRSLLQFRLRARDIQQLGKASMQGVAGLKRVPSNVLLNLPVENSVVQAAARVVEFLVPELHRIRELAEKSERFEALLEEDFAAEIGTVWSELGSELRPLHYAVDPVRPIMYGIVLPGEHVPGGVPVVKGGNVERGEFDLDSISRTTPEMDSRYARSRLQGGDVLITIRGSYGAVAAIPDELAGANITQDTARLAASRDVTPAWLLFMLRAPQAQAQLQAVATGAGVKGVNIGDLKRVKVPVPSLRRQSEILERVRMRADVINRTRGKARELRTRLSEYQDAVITESVTPIPAGRKVLHAAPAISR